MGENGQVSVPLWRMLAMAASVFPVLALQSNLGALESVATAHLKRLTWLYAVAMAITCWLLYLVPAGITLPIEALAITLRALIAWYGISLLSGVILGWRLAWAMPVTTIVFLWYWGYSSQGYYLWWEFTARPPNDVPSLILSGALLLIGIVAYSATPWRRYRLRPRSRMFQTQYR
ncbi:hypothetical protein O7543_19680 [Solwaraspora sp. WMMA2080]|uniref:hypothetical protein n=1 Tax=unclassified Solwaraspora TaxID=2627926 RepID=UPI00248CDC62|nr:MULTISPECIES: hypothetical protein [unclassified Solwaraspora]WBB97000.1 hypothetical protein O7553_27690 [Solwaraspora sp. WMMA2059]WBC19097.1 hypothetical protein O7543_19680 [Solwaraspora sp. WMMA2080]